MAILLDILAAGVVDASGDPLASGTVYVYTPGTTTKATIYTDSALTNTTSNPVTLDAAGRAEIYTSDAVRLVIEDSSGASVDDIESVGEITVNETVGSDFSPSTSATYNLGSSGNAWKAIYLDNTTIDGGTVYFNDAVSSLQCNSTGDELTWDAGTASYIIVEADSGDAGINFVLNNDAANTWALFADNDDSDNLEFHYGGTEMLRLNTSGDLLLQANTTDGRGFIVNQQGAGDAELILRVNGSTDDQWIIRMDNDDTDMLHFAYGASVTRIMGLRTDDGGLLLDNAIGSTTPAPQTLYQDTMPKAWANCQSGGTLNDAVNLTQSKGATGVYAYTFKRAMSNANYAVAVSSSSTPPAISSVNTFTTTTFTVNFVNSSGTAVDVAHSLVIVGSN